MYYSIPAQEVLSNGVINGLAIGCLDALARGWAAGEVAGEVELRSVVEVGGEEIGTLSLYIYLRARAVGPG